ncbi:hypothetical protein HYDPIDRAFT_110263 [Hydnomerulius pinastri MD-312]|nr:hypothetical protein HYDPIDRAFT_110263 [Hydnomerulius pinastri MD-312]
MGIELKTADRVTNIDQDASIVGAYMLSLTPPHLAIFPQTIPAIREAEWMNLTDAKCQQQRPEQVSYVLWGVAGVPSALEQVWLMMDPGGKDHERAEEFIRSVLSIPSIIGLRKRCRGASVKQTDPQDEAQRGLIGNKMKTLLDSS